MGQSPYGWPAPNGHPLAGGAWLGPGAMIARFNAALALARGLGQLPFAAGTGEGEDWTPVEVAAALLGREPSAELAGTLDSITASSLLGPRQGQVSALGVRAVTFASPDFQVR